MLDYYYCFHFHLYDFLNMCSGNVYVYNVLQRIVTPIHAGIAPMLMHVLAHTCM